MFSGVLVWQDIRGTDSILHDLAKFPETSYMVCIELGK